MTGISNKAQAFQQRTSSVTNPTWSRGALNPEADSGQEPPHCMHRTGLETGMRAQAVDRLKVLEEHRAGWRQAQRGSTQASALFLA